MPMVSVRCTMPLPGFGFSMPGDWILTVEVETQDGRSVMTESFLTVAR